MSNAPTIDDVVRGCTELKDTDFRDQIAEYLPEAKDIILVDLSDIDLIDELLTTVPKPIYLLWLYKARELSYLAYNQDRVDTENEGSHKEQYYRDKYNSLIDDIRSGVVVLPIENGDNKRVGAANFG